MLRHINCIPSGVYSQQLLLVDNTLAIGPLALYMMVNCKTIRKKVRVLTILLHYYYPSTETENHIIWYKFYLARITSCIAPSSSMIGRGAWSSWISVNNKIQIIQFIWWGKQSDKWPDGNTRKKCPLFLCSWKHSVSQGLDFVPSRENHIWFSPYSSARIN